jgi:hypothetical protein
MKFFRPVIVLAMLALGACASARSQPAAASAVVVADQVGRSPFGEVYQGEKIRVEFAIRNTAPYRVTIDSIENVCGCTATRLENGILLPGDTQSVWVELDTARLWGPQSKTVILHTDDPYRRAIRLTLEGVVRELLRFDPRRIDAQSPDPSFSTTVQVANAADRDLTIKELAIKPADHVRAAFAGRSLPLRLAPGETATLLVQAELARPGARLVGEIGLTLDKPGVRLALPFRIERHEPEEPTWPVFRKRPQ